MAWEWSEYPKCHCANMIYGLSGSATRSWLCDRYKTGQRLVPWISIWAGGGWWFFKKNSWYILWFCWYLLYEWSVYQCVELMYTNCTISLLFCEKQFRQRCNICNRSHKKTHGTVYWEALSTFVISIRVNKLQPRWTLLQWVCQQFSGTSKDFWIWSLEQIIQLLPQVLHSESQISQSAFQGVSFWEQGHLSARFRRFNSLPIE